MTHGWDMSLEEKNLQLPVSLPFAPRSGSLALLALSFPALAALVLARVAHFRALVVMLMFQRAEQHGRVVFQGYFRHKKP